jgi:hypothetical protein
MRRRVSHHTTPRRKGKLQERQGPGNQERKGGKTKCKRAEEDRMIPLPPVALRTRQAEYKRPNEKKRTDADVKK